MPSADNGGGRFDRRRVSMPVQSDTQTEEGSFKKDLPRRPNSPSADNRDGPAQVVGLEGLLDPLAVTIQGPSGRMYVGQSLGCWRPQHCFRRWSIRMVESPFFDPFILLAIVCNCVTLAWQSPLDPTGTWKAQFLETAEDVFLAIFTFELSLKIVAFGFISHEHSYLRDPWCQLDFFVVSLAWVPLLIPSLGNYSGLRTLRALRPLRTLRYLPGMPQLINAIFNAMPALSSVAMLCLFCFMIFAIIGVELFKGGLHYRCLVDPDLADAGPSLMPVAHALLQQDPASGEDFAEHRRMLKGGGGGNDQHWCFPEEVGDPRACGGGQYGTCTNNFASDGLYNPSFSWFDTCSSAAMAVLSMITFDSISDTMFAVMASTTNSAWIYFVAVAVFGGFFMVNLFLSVLYDKFSIVMAKPSEEKWIPPVRKKSIVVIDGKMVEVEDISCAEQLLKPIVKHPAFEVCSLSIIGLNLVLACLKYEGQSQEQRDLLANVSEGFTVLVILEVSCTIVGLGWEDFWHGTNKAWAPFDFTVLIVSSLDLSFTLMMPDSDSHNMVVFRVLRTLRALRFLRTAKKWEALSRALTALGIGGKNLANLFVLLFLFTFIFAVMGMQAFAGRCRAGSRLHYDYAGPAMLSTLSIITGDWVDVRAACWPTDMDKGSLSDVFYILALLVGFFVLVNLFIAVLFHAFATAFDVSNAAAIAEAQQRAADGGVPKRRSSLSASGNPSSFYGARKGSLLPPPGQLPPPSENACASLVKHPVFENAIILLILVSTVCLAIDVPRLDPTSSLAEVLLNMNYLFVAVFLAEMLLKICACGIGAYCAEGWNLLDAFIVFISVASLLPSLPENLSTLRLLRVLRPLRLLGRIQGMRVIFLFSVTAIGNIVQVIGVVFFCQVVYSILGMELFMGTFASCTDPALTTREECDAATDATGARWLNPVYGSFDNVLAANLMLFVASTGDGWQIFMFRAMDAVASGVAPVRNDSSPLGLYFVLWCVIGSFGTMNLLVGTVVDSFNRVSAENDGSAAMTADQRQWRRVKLLSYSKAKPAEAPPEPDSPPGSSIAFHLATTWWRRPCFHLVTSVPFDTFISVWVFLNVTLMGYDYMGIEEHPKDAAFLDTATQVFVSVYYVEAVLKLIGLGPSYYFSDNWCRFDFTLVCLALLEQFAHALLVQFMPVPPMMFRIMRVLRVLRLLRLLKGSKALQDLIMTLILSFPGLVNVLGLLILVCFMYAVLSVNLFTYVLKPGMALNEMRNFDSVSSASLVLFQTMTFDMWSAVMNDLMITPERGCDPDATPSDCGSILAPVLFFFSFLLFCNFLLLNIVVAVVIDNFLEMRYFNPRLVTEGSIDDYSDEWAKLDPKATGRLHFDECAKLLLRLGTPLGLMDVTKPGSLKMHDLESARVFLDEELEELPHVDHEVEFDALLNALIAKSFEGQGVQAPEEVEQTLVEKRKSVRDSAPDLLGSMAVDHLASEETDYLGSRAKDHGSPRDLL